MTLPGQVDLTNVSATGTSSVKLTWQTVDGITGFMIYRLDTADGKYKQVATVKSAQTLSTLIRSLQQERLINIKYVHTKRIRIKIIKVRIPQKSR